MHRLLPALAAAALAGMGCGYIGSPLPPLANVPQGVEKLAAVQRGPVILVDFAVPLLTTEDVAIRQPVKLDLRVGDPASSVSAWAAQAKPVSGEAVTDGVAHYAIPSTEWIGKEAVIGVRAIGVNGKASQWSNLVALTVVPPPGKPLELRATGTPQGVRLAWVGSGDAFRVFRRAGEEKAFTPVAVVQTPEWVDPSTEFGKPYAYQVQALAHSAPNREAESDFSEQADIIPKDVFPPAAPSGLKAMPAPNSAELTWDANAETNLAGYRVYRAAAGGAAAMIADVGSVPAYSDRAAEHGQAYTYWVTATSKTGYESPRSEPAAATLP